MTCYLPKSLMMLALVLMISVNAIAQGLKATGTVIDKNGDPVIGATICVKGDSKNGTVTDIDGNFQLNVPSNNSRLVISFIGMNTQEATAAQGMRVVLTEDSKQLEEVVVVGYGQQKKASVVGAITQAKGEVLERAAGISDIGAALTGNLPGVITTASSGMPGEEEPQIVIRGASSWNNSAPLVLVDGIERPMSSVEISSVANVSVLKDASATAVYGVKGANGVILITTKRGSEGKAQIGVSANAIVKVPSMLPDKMDSYDALIARNTAIEHELNLAPDAFKYMKPMSFIENYRNQEGKFDENGTPYYERYANVDWQRTMFKDYTMSYNANLNISGGTKFVKYYAAIDFVSEGDLFKEFPSGRKYDTGYDYKRVNVRSNLDFNITKTTVFKVNIAGSNANRQSPWSNSVNNDWQISNQWAGVYGIGPDAFLPHYEDGSWGYHKDDSGITNGAQGIGTGGVQYVTTTRLTTDFVLEQNLDFITKGLSARGMISWDNTFVEDGRGVNDLYTPVQLKYVDPETGEIFYKQPWDQEDHFDYAVGNKWNIANGSVNDRATARNLNYQAQLNWARSFGKHNITAMGLFGRQEYATGNEIPHYREDWVFRATYDWNNRYFFEYNGAYNGSEKFSSDNRFAFFNSGAVGWMISEEPFMKSLREKYIIDMLKIRASYGEIGDDNVGDRFLYKTIWAYGGHTKIDAVVTPNLWSGDHNTSPYYFYRESIVGNPDIHWEKVAKTNFGLDYALFGGLIAGNVEIFHDKRTDILVRGTDRAVPSYYGATPAWVNKGEVSTNGYEIEVRLNKTIGKWHLWANMNMTHAVNEVKIKDDAPLAPAYQRAAGFAIGQTHSHLDHGMMQTFDDIYGSPKHESNDGQKLPGDYYIIDFNGDGVIDKDDSAPIGYTGVPQNTYNATIGAEYKGFSCFVQFYGVTNITRDVTMQSLSNTNQTNVFRQGTWWSDDHTGADILTPRFLSSPSYYYATQYLCDGSFIRLKNIEVAYTWRGGWVNKIGLHDLKVFVSGNNLWMWTRMPDDRESNFSSNGGAVGAYPTMKRINFGIKFNL